MGDPPCWHHLACTRCGRIHGSPDETCSGSSQARVQVARAPVAGSAGTGLGSLNATAVTLPPSGILPRAKLDRDVAYTIIAGRGTLAVDVDDQVEEQPIGLEPGMVAIVAAGTWRCISAGSDGLSWSSVHLRRPAAPLSPSRA